MIEGDLATNPAWDELPTDAETLTGDSEESYIYNMKIRTAVALSEDLLAAIDERVRQSGEQRSEVIEAAVRFFMARPDSVQEGVNDLEILNERAERLNLEAEDVLTYQVIP